MIRKKQNKNYLLLSPSLHTVCYFFRKNPGFVRCLDGRISRVYKFSVFFYNLTQVKLSCSKPKSLIWFSPPSFTPTLLTKKTLVKNLWKEHPRTKKNDVTKLCLSNKQLRCLGGFFSFFELDFQTLTKIHAQQVNGTNILYY